MLIIGLACVDWVISFSEETPLSLIKNIKPDVLVKGGDYSIDGVVGGEEVIQNGGEVKVLSFKKGFSTSAIIKKLQT
jgi:D-beta-D-heptose 7-phosphate kinase/D-beta-D-heptose 1-phosphate adenosyltransferase